MLATQRVEPGALGGFYERAALRGYVAAAAALGEMVGYPVPL